MSQAPAVSHTVTVSFVVDGVTDAAAAARIITDYLDAAAAILPRADIPAVYVDTAAPACGTAADAVARLLGHDGTRWRTDDGRTLDDLAQEYDGMVENRDWRHSPDWKAVFPDGSVITVTAAGWDFGFPECWCMQGNGHESCTAGEG